MLWANIARLLQETMEMVLAYWGRPTPMLNVISLFDLLEGCVLS